ncbi:hypothetical protein [Streptomyces sp. NPDC005538]|uniref:hypothetical protein n=1 Tax=Streptomyces sp. NPDC005538 TaxID=3157043 RepID=UPI0033A4EAA1
MNTLLTTPSPSAPARRGTLHTVGRTLLPTLTGSGWPAGRAARLRDVREADVDRTLKQLAAVGTPVRVGRYTLIEPGQDPAERLAQTQAVVTRRRWEAAVVTWDSTGMTDPALRPQLARLFTAICHGEIHGIVAASRTDISAFDEVYESTLAAIRARGGFLTLARSETTF